MVQLSIMWKDTIPIKLQVHLRYKSMVHKVATPIGTSQGMLNVDPRDTHWNIPLRPPTNPRDLLVEKLVPIPR